MAPRRFPSLGLGGLVLAFMLLLTLGAVPVFAHSGSSLLFGWSLESSVLYVLGDRSRMIQVSCVIVAIGIALLYWKK